MKLFGELISLQLEAEQRHEESRAPERRAVARGQVDVESGPERTVFTFSVPRRGRAATAE